MAPKSTRTKNPLRLSAGEEIIIRQLSYTNLVGAGAPSLYRFSQPSRFSSSENPRVHTTNIYAIYVYIQMYVVNKEKIRGDDTARVLG